MTLVIRSLTLLLISLSILSCTQRNHVNYRTHLTAQKNFPTKAGNLAYRDEGQGKVIVLLHGVPTSSWMYRKIIPGLATKHRVIAVDLIGYGSSAKPKGPAVYEPAAQARRVRALLRGLGISRYSLMMHDMGGLVAWEMMRQDDAAIENLIVLNTIVHQKGFHPPKLEPGFMLNTMTKAYANQWTSETILGITMRNLGLRSNHRLSKEECHGYVQPLRQGSDHAMRAFFSNLDNDLYQRLDQNQHVFRKYRGRTLVLWGAQDETLTTAQIPFLQKHLRIPSSQIYQYPRHNHFLAEENPRELIQRVTAFLSSP